MKIVVISCVRDFAMYDRCVRLNPALSGCEIVPIDNRVRNEGVPAAYNRALAARPAGEDAWYVFCHEDFKLLSPLDLSRADASSLWGPIGASTRVKWKVYHRWQLVGSVRECDKNGANERVIGTRAECGTAVETFDCQCLIVHSSLIRAHNLKFDEALTFDLYVEEFCIAARERAQIASRILPLEACHFSSGSVKARYYVQEAHVNAKYPHVCYTGTSSWILGSSPSWGRKLTVGLKHLVRRLTLKNAIADGGKCRIAIHAHVFYPELWPELRNAIQNFIDVCSLSSVAVYVTYPAGNDELKALFQGDEAITKILEVGNYGYDVAPFFRVIDDLNLSDFDYVVKLHTKRDTPFCSTRLALEKSLKTLRFVPRLGMVAARSLINPGGYDGSGYHREQVAKLISDLALPVKEYTFVYGTMFMVRAELLRPVWRKVRQADFGAIVSGREHEDYGLASKWERAFGMLVRSQGFYVSDGAYPMALDLLFFKFRKFKYRFLHIVAGLIRSVFGHGFLYKAASRWHKN